MDRRKTLIVIGNGMVGHKFLDLMISRRASDPYRIVTFCEETYLAYDRVHLSEYFSDRSADDLALTTADFYAQNDIEVYQQDCVITIDRQQRSVVSAKG